MRADLKNSGLIMILTLLSFATVTTSIAYAAPLAVSDRDWQHVNGNSWAWNYSPQTQINKENVNRLEVKWLYPVASKALTPKGLQSVNIPEGGYTPPIVHDGIVYGATNYLRTYAIDAKTGKELWVHSYEIDMDEVQKRLPIAIGGIMHLHGIRYWEGGDVILMGGIACDFYGLDSKTGEVKFWVKDLCLNVPGNIYKYRPSTANTNEIATYEKGRQFIIVLPGRMHSTLFGPDSRHVTMGIDMDSHQILWRVFSYPPQDRPTKDWALQECDIGFFHTYPCTEVAAVNRAGLEWDWALPGEPPSKWGGVTANWGEPVVDEDTGIIYTQTGNQGPYSNMTFAPGPRLYGSTIMAIDMNKGQRIWWLQPLPHDAYDYDCNWSGILAEVSGLGKVYVKGCKEGTLYVIDAATGKPKYTIDSIDEMVARGQIGPLNGPMYKFYRPDVHSYHDMREWNWISWPATKPGEPGEHFTLPATLIPSWSNGHFATDMSYDPETQTLYHYAAASPRIVLQEFPYVEGGNLFSTKRYPVTNTTIVARDLAKGEVKWTWFYSLSQTRAHMVVSGGMVFTGFPDGFMRFFDKDTGKLLREINLGAPMQIGVTIGKDSDGNSKIFAIIGAQRYQNEPAFLGALAPTAAVPGTVVALGLAEKPAVTTTTVTATTTSATTVVSTTTVTQTAETIGPVTYAAIAVAVVAVIAAAILAARRRPA